MNKFIEIENTKGGINFINLNHILRLKKSDKGSVLFLTDGTFIYPAQDYNKIVALLRQITEQDKQ